jgi:hypothetical protein
MADWRAVSEGIQRGFQRGVAIGGRLSPLGQAIKGVAERLRQQREGGEELRRKAQVLGYKGLIEGTIEPTTTGGFELPGLGRFKRAVLPKEQIQQQQLNIQKELQKLKELELAAKITPPQKGILGEKEPTLEEILQTLQAIRGITPQEAGIKEAEKVKEVTQKASLAERRAKRANELLKRGLSREEAKRQAIKEIVE